MSQQLEALPPGWGIASLGEVCDVNVRGFLPASASGSMRVVFVPMAAVSEEFGGIDIAATRPLQEVVKGYTSFVEGDVLFAKITPCMENGKLAVVPPLPSLVGFGSTEFHVLRSGESVVPRWLAYYLSQREFRRAARQDMSGSAGQLRVQTGWLSAARIPLAPVNEQRRIVDAVEVLLSELDAGVRELQAAQKKLAQYRQSLLKGAVEGALTAEWRARNPPQETGAELLARILRERRARWERRQLNGFKAQGKVPPTDWRAKYVEPAVPTSATESAAATTWAWASIGQCFQVAVGATPSRKEPSYWGGTVPWVSSGEVRFERIAATRECISEAGLNNSSTRMNPVGSVLLGMIGEGKTRGQVAILGIPATNNQNCAAIWVSETDIPPEFVYYWLWSRYDETRRGSSGNNQPALNKTLVEAMPLPVPPVSEAREIVSRVDAQLAGIAAQEREIEQLLRMATAQRQNILRAAFSGQLVPQDPNDEPASVLLARVAAARTALAGNPKRRKPRTVKESA